MIGEHDHASPGSPGLIFDEAERRLGNVTALVMCHCESVDSGLLDTTVESFDRHFAVNARATWFLIREYGRRFRCAPGTGRINSSPVDTGWMTGKIRQRVVSQTPLGRLGTPQD